MKMNAVVTVIFLLLALTACMGPATSRPVVDEAFVAAEKERQKQLVLKTANQRTKRLWTAALPILYANVEMCGEQVAWNHNGSMLNSYHLTSDEYQQASIALGIHALPTVGLVVDGSPVHVAGFKEGDVVVAVNGRRVPTPTNMKSARKSIEMVVDGSAQPTSAMTVLRHGRETTLEVNNRLACDYPVVLLPDDELNAFADGENIYITAGMLRFLESELELQAVLAHELAHNTEGHIRKKKANAGIGAIFGLVLDIAAASQGVSTTFTGDFARLASMRFSQDFEREADYVGIYMMERANLDSSEVGDFWRRMSVENPASISFGRSHPTTAERFVNLDAYSREVRAKRSRSEKLLPELKATKR